MSFSKNHPAYSVERRTSDSVKEEEDAKPLVRCKEKSKSWAKHCQCYTKVQDLKHMPWRNEELKNLEEEVPRLKESDL